ncbi:MAG: DNA mismatch repair protein MutS, partial [Pseudomonadota bacterium]|nr:DNA mismatch repair protein MutS [Pseudomonadota bacterium]
LGWHIDVTKANGDKLMTDVSSETFIHRQTTSTHTRFTTVELSDLAQNISKASEVAKGIELDHFEKLLKRVAEEADAIAAAARAIAALDVAAGLAELACERDYCRPVIDMSHAFEIESGRHPVVEAALSGTGATPFAANDCTLETDSRIWLVTGPNMAGKSTFLRQNALIAVLAQTGAFVPARTARIGVVDRLFSRVGASDDLARGHSTFMVEMVETAAILNRAGERALIILDEIGRGTATFDGLSIAWAVVEHLHEVNRCRALFATHYHELTMLAGMLPSLSCHTMRVKEWQGDVVFLHEVVSGTADRSYGIYVARLAGLPEGVIDRAEEVLRLLEEGEQGGAVERLAEDLPLFQSMAGQGLVPSIDTGPSPLKAALDEIDPDSLTPREALEAFYRLKALAQE